VITRTSNRTRAIIDDLLRAAAAAATATPPARLPPPPPPLDRLMLWRLALPRLLSLGVPAASASIPSKALA